MNGQAPYLAYGYNKKLHVHQQQEEDCQIALQWTPSHCGIPGNELANKTAKEATKVTQQRGDDLSKRYEIAKSLIKRSDKDRPPEHNLAKQSYSNHVCKKNIAELGSRKESATLAQLRPGKPIDTG